MATERDQESLVVGISMTCAHTESSRAIVEQVETLGARAVRLHGHDIRCPAPDGSGIDALILMGNDDDIDPMDYTHRYHENDPRCCIHPKTRSERMTSNGAARADYEARAIRSALECGMPLLGICGGMQRINVVMGGTLHQHVPDLVGSDRHCQTACGIEPRQPVMPLVIQGGTLLAEIARDIPMPFTLDHSPNEPKVIIENSIHHQAIDIVAPGLRVCGLSDAVRLRNGRTGYLVKAVEADPEDCYAGQFLLGVQWHPEFSASSIGRFLVLHLLHAAESYRNERISVAG